VTTLRILSEFFDFPLEGQVLDAALGMHGAGGYRAQCGLVEGALMAVGIIGRRHGLADDQVVRLCYAFAEQFEAEFGSLLCLELRPEGFRPDNPPHLCEELTRRAIQFDVAFLGDVLHRKGKERNGQAEDE